MNLASSGKLLEKVDCIKYLESHIAVYGRIHVEMKFTIKQGKCEKNLEFSYINHLELIQGLYE